MRGVRHPLLVAAGDGQPQATIADWEMTVALPADEKGTHMSRFIALLESHRARPMTPAALCGLAQSMLDLLHADAGDVAARFPYFIEKQAPVSGVGSLMDYQVCWSVRARRGEAPRFSLSVLVPVTSLAASIATDLAIGDDHVCAVAASGIYCWGNNLHGQVGNQSQSDQYTPVLVIPKGAHVLSRIATGSSHTCGSCAPFAS